MDCPNIFCGNLRGEKMVLVAAMVIWVTFVTLIFRSGKEQGDVLQRVSLYVYKKINMWKLPGKGRNGRDTQVLQSLISLYPGGAPELLLQEYHVAKIRIILLILLAGSGIAGLADGVKSSEGMLTAEGALRRPRTQQTMMLEATVNEPEGIVKNAVKGTIVLEVGERVLTDEEAEECYEELIGYLREGILGNNPSLQEVREKLNLPYEVEGYPFTIEWKSSNHFLLTSDGMVFAENLEEPQTVMLTAEVFYGEKEWQESFQVMLCPPQRTEEEQLLYDLKRLAEEAEEAQKHEEDFVLPGGMAGNEISWAMQRDNTGRGILLLTFLAAVAVFYMKDKDLQQELVKRRREMKEEYPVIVSKYALFLEAGMTVRGAFIKICRDYYAKQPDRIHPLYEEMHYSCNELKAGMSESRVYENFGRRTGVQEYTRLCALLGQNLKKGNTALAKRLKEESDDAVTENMQAMKRLGEEAGTKLLAPMGMMLVLVLVMIMLPAFSGLGI